VRGVRLYCQEERRSLFAFEEDNVDGSVPARYGSMQPMHPVDYTHGLSVHTDRRQIRLHLGEQLHMRQVHAGRPRRISREQRLDGNLGVNRWIADLHRLGYATSTIAGIVKLLSMILTDAADEHLIPDNPIHKRRRRGRRSHRIEREKILATATGTADGYAQAAFYFYNGRYLGTDAIAPSAGISEAWQDDTTVALSYQLYNTTDPMCCPTAGSAIVRFHWTGTQLVPLDPIPPNEGAVDGSRR